MIREMLYAANYRLPTEKAHGYQTVQMCQAFVEAGVSNLTLLYPDRVNPGMEGENLESYYGLRMRLPAEKLHSIDKITWITERFPHARKLQALAFYAQVFSFAWSLSRYCKKFGEKKPLLYLRDLQLGGILLWLLPEWRSELVLELHGLSANPHKRKTQAQIIKRFEKVICLTHQMKHRLVEAGVAEHKMLVAHDAVDLGVFNARTNQQTARSHLGIPPEGKIAAYVGKFHQMGQEKGIPDILRAAPHILKEFPSLRFYFVGGPLSHVAAYQTLIGEMGLPPSQFFFLEKQPIEKVPLYLAAADILLMPSPWTEQYAYYTSPLKMFEYMSARKPILATDLPSFREVFRDKQNALLVNPGDAKDIASGVLRILQDEGLAQGIADTAWKEVQNLSWKNRAEIILDWIGSQ